MKTGPGNNTSRSSRPEAFCKNAFLEISQNSQENTCTGILYKSRDLLSKQCLKQLYFSFVHNYANYASIVQASTSKNKLYCFQKHAAQFITKISIHMQVLFQMIEILKAWFLLGDK